AIKKIIPKTDLNREFKMVSYGDSLNYRGYRFVFSGSLTDKGHDIAIPLYSLSPVTLRHRQAGDRLFLGEFSKKLRRLFIDGKFTSEQRQNAIVGEQAGVIIFVLVGDETYLRKASKHDIMLAKLYIDKLEKR
ncbi:TPA: tRNA lysidine(34) synthetase TilS, partial [Streptococcus equi subsp. equi]|nr:tRNA lysidine(34) synthetase TilS [Streptococcus equi subsp. equi]